MHTTKLTLPDSRDGFSLVEILLSIGISALILVSLSLALSQVLESRVKQQVITEVEQQGTQVIQLITQSIRNADSINSPSISTSDAALSLNVYDAAADPTLFSVSSGIIQIQEGAGAPIGLTATPVTASDLIFTNLSQPGTPGTVRLQFTLTYTNPSGRHEYDYTKTFYASASVR